MSSSNYSETLGSDTENQDFVGQDQGLVLVKTSLGIGKVEASLHVRAVLVLPSCNGKQIKTSVGIGLS